MILLVMYQIEAPRNSASVYEMVAKFGPASHVLDSFCLVSTERTPIELHKEMRKGLSAKENVFITQLTQKHSEYLPKPALEWIAAQNGDEVKPRAAGAGSM